MAPLSKNSEMCTEIGDSVLKIAEILEKCQIETETSTYDIDDIDDDDNSETKQRSDEEAEDNLDDCTIIKEKGLVGHEKYNNNRLLPYERNPTNSNNRRQNIVYTPTLDFNNTDLTQILNYLRNDSTEIIDNIPITVSGLDTTPLIEKTDAQKELSEFIGKNKEEKRNIWILVNLENVIELLAKLSKKIESKRLNHNDLKYIYAIIIRLLKDDGKQILLDYLSTENVLIKVALKQNVLLMNFILELYYNNNIINDNQAYILHDIINQQELDLRDIFGIVINYKLSNNNYMFDVNRTDINGENVLMVLCKHMGMGNTNPVNLKYLELILNRNPDVTTTIDGKNIFDIAYYWECDENIIQKIKSHYDVPFFINNLDSYTYNDAGFSIGLPYN